MGGSPILFHSDMYDMWEWHYLTFPEYIGHRRSFITSLQYSHSTIIGAVLGTLTKNCQLSLPLQAPQAISILQGRPPSGAPAGSLLIPTSRQWKGSLAPHSKGHGKALPTKVDPLDVSLQR